MIGISKAENKELLDRMELLGYDRWYLGGWFDHKDNSRYEENIVMLLEMKTKLGNVTITHLYREDNIQVSLNGECIYTGDYLLFYSDSDEFLNKGIDGFIFPRQIPDFIRRCLTLAID